MMRFEKFDQNYIRSTAALATLAVTGFSPNVAKPPQAVPMESGVPVLVKAGRRAMDNVAGHHIRTVDCGYAAIGTEGYSIPALSEVFLKPWVCAEIDKLVSRPSVISPRIGAAVLVATHESVHQSNFVGAKDETMTECHALTLVVPVAEVLGAKPAVAEQIASDAAVAHQNLLAKYPDIYKPC